jgi:Ca-activated chloride channel family protein
VSFDTPGAFYCFLLFPPLIILGVVHYYRRRRVLDLFAPSAGAASPGSLRFRYFLSSAFFLTFLGCVILALAGPRWGTRLSPEFRRGLDVILAVDLSRSMDVRDMPDHPETPSRLERGILLARTLAANAGGNRFGVVIGKGMGVLAVPLTEDTEVVLSFLEGLSTGVLTGTGTNLESLIDAASGAFIDAFPTRRRIVLFSDGEALRGSFSAAIDRAAERDITLTVVGLGSETGGPVPGDPGAERRDESLGIISFLRAETLRNAASRTGGIYIDGGEESAAARLLGDLLSASADSFTGGFKREVKRQWHLFILAALTALGLSKLSARSWRRGT